MPGKLSSFVLLAVSVMLSAGCSNTPSDRVIEIPRVDVTGGLALPPLPVDKTGAGLTEYVIDGVAVFDKSSGAVENGTALEMPAVDGDQQWAVYAFDPQGNSLDSTAVLLEVDEGGEVWIGLADYSTGRWKLSGPFDGGQTLSLTDDADYLSPAGLFYVALIAAGTGNTTVNALSVRTINPNNTAPTADLTIEAGSEAGLAPHTVSFDASGSSDTDGTIQYYFWDFDGDGGYDSITFLPATDFTYMAAGLFNATVAVIDDQGAHDTASVSVDVNIAGNDPPVAALALEDTPGNAPQTLSFSAALSSDSDGSIVRFDWDFDGDGNWDVFDGQPAIDHLYNEGGVYPAQVRVTDDAGAQDIAVVEFGLNELPRALLSVSPREGNENTTLYTFDASASFDPDGTIELYSFDLNEDGLFDFEGPDAVIQSGAEGAGWVDILLRVTDNQGATSEASFELFIHGWDFVDVRDGELNTAFSLCEVQGRPAMFYCNDTDDTLVYVSALDGEGSAWGDPIIIDSGTNSGYTAMMIVGGRPALAYRANVDGDLHYLRANNAAGTSWPAPLTLDTENAGTGLSLAIVADRPAVSYVRLTVFDLYYLRADDSTGSAWTGTPVPVFTSTIVSEETSMRVVNGAPAIAYYSESPNRLNFIRASDNVGSVWGNANVVVDTLGNSGRANALVVAGGMPLIVYNDVVNEQIRAIRASEINGNSWLPAVLLTDVADIGSDIEMTLFEGLPAVVYNSTTPTQISVHLSLDGQGLAWDDPENVDFTGGQATIATINDRLSTAQRNFSWTRYTRRY